MGDAFKGPLDLCGRGDDLFSNNGSAMHFDWDRFDGVDLGVVWLILRFKTERLVPSSSVSPSSLNIAPSRDLINGDCFKMSERPEKGSERDAEPLLERILICARRGDGLSAVLGVKGGMPGR